MQAPQELQHVRVDLDVAFSRLGAKDSQARLQSRRLNVGYEAPLKSGAQAVLEERDEPGGAVTADDDLVAATRADLKEGVGIADDASVEHRFGQAAHWVAAVLFGDAQHLASAFLRVNDQITAAHGQGQRLFAEHVQAQVERGRGHRVV